MIHTLTELLMTQREWSSQTFDTDFTGPLNHLKREIEEIKAEADDDKNMFEFADGMLLLLDGFWRRHPNKGAQDLLYVCVEKQKINMSRTWQNKNAEGFYEHERGQVEQKPKRITALHVVEVPDAKERIDAGIWRRAAGECICPVCGLAYTRHPNVQGFDWLTLLCNGLLVKL